MTDSPQTPVTQETEPKKTSFLEPLALVLRPNSGVSGDILVTGLYLMCQFTPKDLDEALKALGLSELVGKVRVVPRSFSSISGWGLDLKLPQEHVHRDLGAILPFFQNSALSARAKELAIKTFTILAEAESKVHGIPANEIHFHEVGALDSILDTGLAALMFDYLNPQLFVCGPLPICDGTIECAHGLLPSPAPAVSHLLEGVAVRGIDSEGETVTPTGLALLKAFGAKFGPWPEMTVDIQALVYGTRVLPKVPNGALFAKGPITGSSLEADKRS
ncbi:MAG: LarC family nickel insertion protein [Deltaproteobacteria bacterium]|jgi:uncharacterized protein (DUF111 family)|nr:LarC family nickel insertion protein [Deltaproteobacteria bacterium]